MLSPPFPQKHINSHLVPELLYRPPAPSPKPSPQIKNPIKNPSIHLSIHSLTHLTLTDNPTMKLIPSILIIALLSATAIATPVLAENVDLVAKDANAASCSTYPPPAGGYKTYPAPSGGYNAPAGGYKTYKKAIRDLIAQVFG